MEYRYGKLLQLTITEGIQYRGLGAWQWVIMHMGVHGVHGIGCAWSTWHWVCMEYMDMRTEYKPIRLAPRTKDNVSKMYMGRKTYNGCDIRLLHGSHYRYL